MKETERCGGPAPADACTETKFRLTPIRHFASVGYLRNRNLLRSPSRAALDFAFDHKTKFIQPTSELIFCQDNAYS